MASPRYNSLPLPRKRWQMKSVADVKRSATAGTAVWNSLVTSPLTGSFQHSQNSDSRSVTPPWQNKRPEKGERETLKRSPSVGGQNCRTQQPQHPAPGAVRLQSDPRRCWQRGPLLPFRSCIGIPSLYWGLVRRTMFLSEGPKV